MFRVDHPTASVVLPTPAAPGAPGFFTKGDPLLAIPATRVQADWLNAVQEELANAIEGTGGTLDKGDRSQLLKTIGRVAGSAGNVLINCEGVVRTRPAVAHAGVEVIGQAEHWWFKTGAAGDDGSLTGGSPLTNENTIGWPSRPQTHMRLQKTTNANTGVNPAFRQSVEGIHWFSGQLVVFAFDAMKNSGSDLPVTGAEIVQDFGTGSGSADVTTVLTSAGAVTIDGTPRRFIFVGTLPAVTGKDINANAHLKVRVKFGTNQLFDVFVSAFVLARGSVDPGYLPRPFLLEEALCRRYFESNPPNANAEGMDVGLWDMAFSLTAGDVETLKRPFRFDKYPASAAATTWFAHDQASGFITEGATTKHAVTAQFAGVGGSGYPRITTPPAGGTLRFFRAFWRHEAEIPD